MNVITAERLRELFHYDPDTGIFTRKVPICNVKAGKVTGSMDTKGHLGFRVDKRMCLAHRMAWLYVHGELPMGQIDHINGIRTDNRIANLRDVSASVNAQNLHAARSDNKTGLLGVSWKAKANKYVAQIQVDGRVRYLGLFHDPNAAHQAYLNAKRANHPGCTI